MSGTIVIDHDRHDRYDISTSLLWPSSEVVELHPALTDSILTDILAGPTVLVVRGNRSVGKTNLRRALTFGLLKHRLLVVQITSALQSPSKVHRLIGDAVDIAVNETLGPDDVPRKLQSAHSVGDIVLLVDDAEELSVTMFRYLWLMVKLLRFSGIRLHLVLFGGLGRWHGFEDPELEHLRALAEFYAIVPATYDKPSGNTPFLSTRFALNAALLAVVLPLLVATSTLINQRHPAPGLSTMTVPAALPSVPSVPTTVAVQSVPTTKPAGSAARVMAPVAPSAAALAESPPRVMTIAPQHALADRASSRRAPGLVLVARRGDTIHALYAKVYRGLTPPPYKEVVAANHAPLKPGAVVVFPAPPNGWTQH